MIPRVLPRHERDAAHIESVRAMRSIFAPDLSKMAKKCLMGCINKATLRFPLSRGHWWKREQPVRPEMLSPRAAHCTFAFLCTRSRTDRPRARRAPSTATARRGAMRKGGEGLSGAVALFLRSRERARDSILHKSRSSDGSQHQSLAELRSYCSYVRKLQQR